MTDLPLSEVAQTGNQLDTLHSLRDMLAADLDACESMRDKAALSQRLLDTLARIAEVEKAQPAKKGTALDEFTRRRSERQATGSSGAAKRNQRG